MNRELFDSKKKAIHTSDIYICQSAKNIPPTGGTCRVIRASHAHASIAVKRKRRQPELTKGTQTERLQGLWTDKQTGHTERDRGLAGTPIREHIARFGRRSDFRKFSFF